MTGIGSLRGVKKVVCDLNLIDLATEIIKILGINFSYDSNLQIQENFLRIVKNINQFVSDNREV